MINKLGGPALIKFLRFSNLNNSNDVKIINDQIDALLNDVPQLLSELCRCITWKLVINSGRKKMCGNLKSAFNALKTFVNGTAQDQIGFAQITSIKY